MPAAEPANAQISDSRLTLRTNSDALATSDLEPTCAPLGQLKALEISQIFRFLVRFRRSMAIGMVRFVVFARVRSLAMYKGYPMFRLRALVGPCVVGMFTAIV